MWVISGRMVSLFSGFNSLEADPMCMHSCALCPLESQWQGSSLVSFWDGHGTGQRHTLCTEHGFKVVNSATKKKKTKTSNNISPNKMAESLIFFFFLKLYTHVLKVYFIQGFFALSSFISPLCLQYSNYMPVFLLCLLHLKFIQL